MELDWTGSCGPVAELEVLKSLLSPFGGESASAGANHL